MLELLSSTEILTLAPLAAGLVDFSSSSSSSKRVKQIRKDQRAGASGEGSTAVSGEGNVVNVETSDDDVTKAALDTGLQTFDKAIGLVGDTTDKSLSNARETAEGARDLTRRIVGDLGELSSDTQKLTKTITLLGGLGIGAWALTRIFGGSK